MNKLRFLFLTLLIPMFALAGGPTEKHQYVKISSRFGTWIVMLYNETPKHRDNFVKLVKEGFYDSLLFHRVIHNFMIQGGDPASKKSATGTPLGEGDVGYTVPAEFVKNLYHKRGALAAARTNNPEKASSGCQFYLVQGKKFKYDELDKTKYSAKQIDDYVTAGGTPYLDQNYTVFGMTVDGIEMIDRIAAQKTDAGDRPVSNISMTISMLSEKEAAAWDKKLFSPKKEKKK